MRTIRTVAGLREVHRQPSQTSLDKEVDHLDRHCRDFIAHAPVVVVAISTGDGSRLDESYRKTTWEVGGGLGA